MVMVLMLNEKRGKASVKTLKLRNLCYKPLSIIFRGVDHVPVDYFVSAVHVDWKQFVKHPNIVYLFPEHDCKEFRCTKREFCIATDLVCDGVNHCGDDSDEASFPKCSRNDAGTMFGMSMTLFVVAIVSGILIVCSFIVGVSICVCRRPPLHHQTTNFPQVGLEPCRVGPKACARTQHSAEILNLSLLSGRDDHWEIRGLESFEIAAEEGRAAESAQYSNKSIEWKLSIFFMLNQRHSGAV
ncbi:unnamed protein product, partial [Nesidiocoris tenuis]